MEAAGGVDEVAGAELGGVEVIVVAAVEAGGAGVGVAACVAAPTLALPVLAVGNSSAIGWIGGFIVRAARAASPGRPAER